MYSDSRDNAPFIRSMLLVEGNFYKVERLRSTPPEELSRIISEFAVADE